MMSTAWVKWVKPDLKSKMYRMAAKELQTYTWKTTKNNKGRSPGSGLSWKDSSEIAKKRTLKKAVLANVSS